jgi:ADP-L-glycero-D-manno-heptose 6-epimerase
LKKIIVTGVNGFVGKNLKSILDLSRIETLGIDDEYYNSDNWSNTLLSILNKFKPSVIFHVGACSDTLETNVQYMMERNYESTKVISDWCQSHGSEMIYSSSAANYGITGEYPSNLYGWSKYVAEDYVIKNGGIALRYFNVYGPGEENKGRMASFLFQSFLNSKNGRTNYLFPKTPKRDFVYVKDVVSANIFAHENYSLLQGSFYEVSTGIATTFEEILDKFGLDYEYSDEAAIPIGYQFYTCGDKSKWMSGWKPEYLISEGISEYKRYLTSELIDKT